MWKKFAKNLGISLFVSLLPLPFANACGIYYYGEEYRIALLNPAIVGEEWSPFYYSANWLNSYQNDQAGNDRKRNCADWAAYIGNGVSVSDVNAVVYGVNYDELLNAIAEGADNQPFAGNFFFQSLLKKDKKPVLDYLLLAKEYEHFSAIETTDPWTENWGGTTENAMTTGEKGKQDVQVKILKKYKEEKNPFLRRRYAYQLLVMSRYDADEARFEQLYAEHFRDDHSDALSNWATFHRAGIVGNPAEANYLLAQSFLSCPEKRIYCYQHFDKKLMAKTLALCKDNSERSLVLGLAVLRNPGKALPQIKEMQTLDVKCPLLPLLLVREISKLEDWLLTDELTGMGAASYPNDDSQEKWEWDNQQWEAYRNANKLKDKAYLAQVRDFAVVLASQKGGALPTDLANLLAGHLYLIDKQAVAAEKHFTAISQKAGPHIAEQQTTEQILLLLNRDNIADGEVKDRLVKLMNQLKAAVNNRENGKRDFAALNLLASEEFLKKGDLVAAYFFNNHALELPTAQRYDFGTAYYELIRYLDWRATEKDIDQVLAVMQKKNKTEFEKYLTSGFLPSRNALLDLRGTISFRKNDLNEAAAAFEKVDQDFWETKYEFSKNLISNPFVMAKDSVNRGEFPATKTEFVKRLMELETSAKSNPTNAADAYLSLGTAWLNCTYHGKSWMMYCYGKSTSDWPIPLQYGPRSYSPTSKEAIGVYFQGERAMSYLRQAKAATNDREILAKADYLMAKLQSWSYVLTPAEQEIYDALDWTKYDKFNTDKEMTYFKDWANAYKSTSYYDEMAATCPVLVTYFGK